jgi:hypothetical protein
MRKKYGVSEKDAIRYWSDSYKQCSKMQKQGKLRGAFFECVMGLTKIRMQNKAIQISKRKKPAVKPRPKRRRRVARKKKRRMGFIQKGDTKKILIFAGGVAGLYLLYKWLSKGVGFGGGSGSGSGSGWIPDLSPDWQSYQYSQQPWLYPGMMPTICQPYFSIKATNQLYHGNMYLFTGGDWSNGLPEPQRSILAAEVAPCASSGDYLRISLPRGGGVTGSFFTGLERTLRELGIAVVWTREGG